MEIPEDLRVFLSKNNHLDYDHNKAECGSTELHSIEDLSVGSIWLAPEDINTDGYHEIPAVKLISDCKVYEADYILFWLPNENVYGSWDCDHWSVTIFPDTTWASIVKNPLPYLNAQWQPEAGIGQLYKPYDKYKLKAGMPF